MDGQLAGWISGGGITAVVIGITLKTAIVNSRKNGQVEQKMEGKVDKDKCYETHIEQTKELQKITGFMERMDERTKSIEDAIHNR